MFYIYVCSCVSERVLLIVPRPSAPALHSSGYYGARCKVVEQMCRRRGLTLTEMGAEVRWPEEFISVSLNPLMLATRCYQVSNGFKNVGGHRQKHKSKPKITQILERSSVTLIENQIHGGQSALSAAVPAWMCFIL